MSPPARQLGVRTGASPLTSPPAFGVICAGTRALLFDGFDELANRVRSAAIPSTLVESGDAARDRARVDQPRRTLCFSGSAVDVLLSQWAVRPLGLPDSFRRFLSDVSW